MSSCTRDPALPGAKIHQLLAITTWRCRLAGRISCSTGSIYKESGRTRHTGILRSSRCNASRRRGAEVPRPTLPPCRGATPRPRPGAPVPRCHAATLPRSTQTHATGGQVSRETAAVDSISARSYLRHDPVAANRPYATVEATWTGVAPFLRSIHVSMGRRPREVACSPTRRTLSTGYKDVPRHLFDAERRNAPISGGVSRETTVDMTADDQPRGSWPNSPRMRLRSSIDAKSIVIEPFRAPRFT